MKNKIRAVGALVLVILWAALTGFAWLTPPKESSDSERRQLAQFPKLTAKTLLDGRFMNNFEDYATDQFPGRELFRQIKAIFHGYGLLQQDNNDIYYANGYLAKQDYPLNMKEVTAATNRITWIYENYLRDTGSQIYCAVIPDKGYYLAAPSGHLTMDYNGLFAHMENTLPWATHIDLTGSLELSDYYYTDTHWRQENLVETAGVICQALQMPAPTASDFDPTLVTDQFYGVYHGQAALPLPAETLQVMENERINALQVRIHNGREFAPVDYTGVYDMAKLTGKEPYDVFLSGTQSLIRIDNPNAATDRELIIFRDSFGSSIAPLLVAEYKTVTLVDTRYLDSRLLSRYLEFNGQDVLFMYSTLVLNTGSMIK
jgi:hypothetical protein